MSETDTKDLSALKLPELRKLAADKGLKGISALRKGELITAIQTGQVPAKAVKAVAEAEQPAAPQAEQQQKTEQKQQEPAPAQDKAQSQSQGQDSQQQSAPAEAEKTEKTEQADKSEKSSGQSNDDDDSHFESRSQARRARRNRARHNDSSDGGNQGQGQNQNQGQNQQHGDDQQGSGRRGRRNRRNRRNRDDQQNQGQNQNQGQQNQNQSQEDEFQDVAGILDVVDNNAAFVRTTGYRTSQADVFVNNNLVKRFGLRSGDAITGQVKMGGGGHTHGNGRNRKKYNQLTRVDTVNGVHPEESRKREEFHKLTPLYPNQRLRLETESNILTTRVIDLVMPIGKGQRALIVSPPKAGKTTILQNIANAIATNNPECYLMVVLVDERPEEVTDMQRSVKGEVIASTFDRPPGEHTAVAELAIERAKRLVEMGKDVVVLLDSITRLGRAYNNSSPASGRILSGGVDSNALYPPKRFLGAARNIENGGSLTIIATAMVETGSAGDTVIFEEFKGTGNAELKLDRKISERRVFPAVDVNPSGTRKDELLLAPDEARIMHKLRRILSALDPQQAIDLLIKQLKKTKSNGEFLLQVASSAPMAADKDTEEYL